MVSDQVFVDSDMPVNSLVCRRLSYQLGIELGPIKGRLGGLIAVIVYLFYGVLFELSRFLEAFSASPQSRERK